MKIEDGTGTGKRAKVSSQNRLEVNAVHVAEMTHISSTDGGAYSLHLDRTFLAADTIENIGFLQYTGEYKLQVNTIYFSREGVALLSGEQARIELTTGDLYTSGGTLTTPVNLNIGSSSALSASVYSGATDIVLDKTSEVDMFDIVIENNANISFEGALILNKNDSIGIVGKSKNIGDIVYVILEVFEVKDVI